MRNHPAQVSGRRQWLPAPCLLALALRLKGSVSAAKPSPRPFLGHKTPPGAKWRGGGEPTAKQPEKTKAQHPSLPPPPSAMLQSSWARLLTWASSAALRLSGVLQPGGVPPRAPAAPATCPSTATGTRGLWSPAMSSRLWGLRPSCLVARPGKRCFWDRCTTCASFLLTDRCRWWA